jgi:hypothetical protein
MRMLSVRSPAFSVAAMKGGIGDRLMRTVGTEYKEIQDHYYCAKYSRFVVVTLSAASSVVRKTIYFVDYITFEKKQIVVQLFPPHKTEHVFAVWW